MYCEVIRKPYADSLNNLSDLPSATTRNHTHPTPPMGQSGVIKRQILWFWLLSPLLLLLELLKVSGGHRRPYTGNLESWSDLRPGAGFTKPPLFFPSLK